MSLQLYIFMPLSNYIDCGVSCIIGTSLALFYVDFMLFVLKFLLLWMKWEWCRSVKEVFIKHRCTCLIQSFLFKKPKTNYIVTAKENLLNCFKTHLKYFIKLRTPLRTPILRINLTFNRFMARLTFHSYCLLTSLRSINFHLIWLVK